MMTAHATVESAIEAMKLGALDYLQKPLRDRRAAGGRPARARASAAAHRASLPAAASATNSSTTTASSDAAARCRRSSAAPELRRARPRAPVLITGETGTGKELVARAIHDRSAQRDMPLIKVNCAAIPETLLESELLRPRARRVHRRDDDQEGQVRARRRRHDLPGRDRHDEPGAADRSCCACCRSASSSRSDRERTERVDVRVIAATNRDLRQMVADGKFQEDLFYRLNVIPIEIPPLRERRDDIPALVDHFVRKHAQRTGRRIDRVDEGAMTVLQQCDWPGNVRELENTIERAVVLSRRHR